MDADQQMNIRIPGHALPEAFESFDVTAEVDFVPDMVVDSYPKGSGDHFRLVPVYGNLPTSIDQIVIETGGEQFSSAQLKELVEEVRDYVFLGNGLNDINPT